jgi:hypothetical protein
MRDDYDFTGARPATDIPALAALQQRNRAKTRTTIDTAHMNQMNAPIETALPANLLQRAREHVAHGGATDLDTLIAEALTRYLDSHETALEEAFIREDVEWGLHGPD